MWVRIVSRMKSPEPEDAAIFENITNRMDEDDVLFGNLKWLENFKQRKKARIEPLYKDCSEYWTSLCFSFHLFMRKSDISSSDLTYDSRHMPKGKQGA